MKFIHKIGWKISRHWNKLMFLIMKSAKNMLWDYTGRNSDLIEDLIKEDTKEILTYDKWMR